MIELNANKKVEEIERYSAEYSPYRNCYVNRSQFPICVAWAITIHRSQGLSLEAAIVNIGQSCFEPGMAYVALSRIRNSSGLYLTEFDPSQLRCNEKAVYEYNRLRKKFQKN